MGNECQGLMESRKEGRREEGQEEKDSSGGRRPGKEG